MEKEDIVKYWIESSDSDFQVMESLFANEHYVWALFLGHLVVEKLLKAYHVRNVDADYPRIHNLLEIAHKASLELSDEQKLMVWSKVVTPVKTGVQCFCNSLKSLDSGFHRNDDSWAFLTFDEFVKVSHVGAEHV